MKLEPLTSQTPKPIALLTPGNRQLYVETVYGKQLFTGKRDIENALTKLTDFVCYVSSGLQALTRTTGATQWLLSTWHGRDVKMTHVPTGLTVTSLRHTLDGSTDPFGDLIRGIKWLRSYGVKPASLSSMSWQLLRASLSKPLTIGADPELTRPAFFGGRQQIEKPQLYRQTKSIDIRAAYPAAMAARPVALSLRKVHPSTYLNPMEAGIATATVHVPSDLPHPPLPKRVEENAIQFQWGTLHGTWTWCELQAAIQLGCDVQVEDCYAPRRTYDLFGTWWEMARTGRDLPGAASNFAKAVANSTWGQFAMRGGDRGETQWVDDKGNESFTTLLPPRGMPHQFAVHVAAEITSRVRTQTLLEGLYGTTGTAIHTDTDGMIIYKNAQLPTNTGPGFGQWSIRETMKVVEIRAPQFYRYKSDDLDQWQYVASGMTPAQAALTFDRYGTVRTCIAFLDATDVTLPPANAHDEATITRLLEEAKNIA